MNIFKLRPLALGCFCAIVAMYLAYFLGNIFDIAIIVISAVALVTIITIAVATKSDKSAKWLSRILPLCLCLIIALSSSLIVFETDKKILEKYENQTIEVTLEITEIRLSKPYETIAIAKLMDENAHLILSLPDDKVEVGDVIGATVTFRALKDSAIGYSESDFYLSEGIFMSAEAQEYSVVEQIEPKALNVLKSINKYLSSLVEKSVNSDTASLISAMLLGNKDMLGADIKRDFSALGISHILALSGIHISLISSMLGAFLELIKLRRKPRYFIIVGTILLFIGITGFSPSALRAGFMLIIFHTLSLVGFDGDGVTTLFFSVLIIIAIDPYSIFSVSLMLSFVAMLACICASYFTKGVRVLYRIRPKFIRGAVYMLITSCVVMLFTLPIIAIFFDHVSIFAPIFNIIFVPILTLLLYISPFVLILGNIPYVSVIVTYPAELITKATLYLSSKIARADFLTVSFTTIAHQIAILIIAMAIIFALILKRKMLKKCALTLVLGVALFASSSIYVAISRANSVSISSYNYLSYDIVAIESDNEVMIIEASSPSKSTTSCSGFYASKIGYSDIQLYVVTDYSYRIAEALDSVTDITRVREIMLPTPKTDEEMAYFDEVSKIAVEKEVKLSQIPEKFNFGDTCVDFMGYERLGRSTKRCVAYSVSACKSRFTYLGASAYEYISYFPGNYARASNAILFGSYGPVYKMEYSFDIPNAECVIFHENAQEYCAIEIPAQAIKPPMHKIIIKN
ncbi:MAG: ComEC/Rec2 family competence protein [Clostridia bacterium]|nr:ComEC/Rec2 family competence protein [Clostridia bacterium]